MEEFIIEMKHIKKNFGDVHAIKKGYFNLIEGEIHSLIGENGAGKSTLMKLLFGMYDLTSGEIYHRGNLLDKMTPKTAIFMGIGMVHQEFMLIDNLSVWENIILGYEPRKGMKIDVVKAKRDIKKYIEKYGLNVDINKRINQISVGEAQRVEIIKVLSKGADIIILDEPTAVLTPQEVESLFVILRNLKKDGKTIIFISHKMDEVIEISDRITVMRQGEHIGTVINKDISPSQLSSMMIGREVFIDKNHEKRDFSNSNIVLNIENLWVSGEKEISKIRGINLQLREGEILGIAGIDGNGQIELEEAIAGLRKVEKGNITLNDENITNLPPEKIRKFGFSFIPSNRNTRGLNREMSIEENLVSPFIKNEKYSKSGIIKNERVRENSEKLIEKYDIRPAVSSTLTKSQSGGNAQKVVVAREVSSVSSVLLASQPTRGVDIGAIESIHSIIKATSESGIGVILISADLGEIMALSDRIIVMYEGKFVADIPVDEANEEKLGLFMMGGKLTEFTENRE